MDFDTYQNEAIRTASNEGDKVAIFALGLCGEAGEVADLIKKHKGHGHDLDKAKITKELGDVLWYIATLADQLGINLGVIAQVNVIKLRARYPNGFNVADSKVKRDEIPSPTPTAPTATFSVRSGIPRGPDLDGLARREAGDMRAGSYAIETWPKPHAGSPVGVDANGSPVDRDVLTRDDQGREFFNGKPLTCNECKADDCSYRGDAYNTEGDCLEEK